MRSYEWLHSVASSYDSVEGFTRVGPAYFEKVYYPSPLRLDGLLAGVVLAGIKYFRPSWWQAFRERRWILIVLGMMGGIITFLLFRDRFSLWPTVLGYPILSFTLAMFVAVAAMWEPPSRRWSVPGAEFIAKISFSLYLSHKLAFHLAKVNFASIDAAGGLYALALYSVAALVAGSALYFCVEFPFLWLRDKIMNRPKLRLSPQPQCISIQIR
jgi:peptidoglycan/LPS O-acetylase OafA/YrhL